MKVRIRDASVGFVGLMDREIGDHPLADEAPLYKRSRKSDILLRRQLILQSDIEAISELRFLVTFGVFDRVP